MGTFVGILIFFTIVATLVLFIVGFANRFEGDSYHRIWRLSLYSFIATCALFILLSIVSAAFMLSDLVFVLWILITVAMFAFLFLGVVFRKNENSRNKHFIRAASFFIAGFLCFFIFIVSLSIEDSTSEKVASNNVSGTEESSEETTEETTTEEEKVAAEEKKKADKEKKGEEERKAEEKAEKEKAAKEAAEKEKEESIEAAKKEEASIEAEKNKEESIETEKAKEESIEKAEEEKSIEEEKAAEKEKEVPEEESAPVKEGLIPVNLYRVTDGDTVNVFDDNGKTLKLRLLLIDTPETVHPSKPVEPYGKEASARLTQLLNNANQLYIEYDTGDKKDHYDRHLVYLYADDVNVHEVLLKEGLARVGYIYEQQKYLSQFREAEQYAKDRKLGIWSIPGYVNKGGEGFNSEEPELTVEEPTTSEPAQSEPATTEHPAQPEYFDNCDHLRGTYPSGVAQGHPAYQPKMDRDKDGWACEVS